RATLVMSCAVVANLGCHPDPPTSTGEGSGTSSSEPSSSGSGEGATTDIGSATTGEVPDIADWVGEYHGVPLIVTLGSEFTVPDDGLMGFTNFEVRVDMTASNVSDDCDRDEPIHTDYRLEFVDAD